MIRKIVSQPPCPTISPLTAAKEWRNKGSAIFYRAGRYLYFLARVDNTARVAFVSTGGDDPTPVRYAHPVDAEAILDALNDGRDVHFAETLEDVALLITSTK